MRKGLLQSVIDDDDDDDRIVVTPKLKMAFALQTCFRLRRLCVHTETCIHRFICRNFDF